MTMKRWIIVTCIITTLLSSVGCLNAQQKNVRPAHVAGQFYPGTKNALEQQIQEYLAQAKKVELGGALRALVAPHAGYMYSGLIAAYAYKKIDRPFKRVFILASSHSADFQGLSVPADYTHYATPLGEVKVAPLVQELVKQDRIAFVPAAHTAHVVEVQLPFLQMTLQEFEIIPVITGRMDWNDVLRFSELFNNYVDEDTLFIVSTDLSHYHPYEEAVQLDTACVKALEQLDPRGVINSELCGQGAALILLEIAKKQGWQGQTLDYRNSGDTSGEKGQVVGYSAIAYYAKNPVATGEPENKKADVESAAPPVTITETLSEAEQAALLELAKTTLELYVKGHQVFEPELERFSEFPNLGEPRGTFVTLKIHDELRGCIGDLLGRQPLYLGVRDNAINAAVHDPRFQPVTPEELPNLRVSISVLDVPQLFPVSAPEEYLAKLTHQDGVILISGAHRATYLPQVWEQLPEPELFLGQLCLKGGAPPDCWKDPQTQVYTYRAQEFGED